jgi:hypothetical protein
LLLLLDRPLYLLLLRGRRHTRRHATGNERKQRGPKLSHDFHGKPPDFPGPWCERNNPTRDWFIAEASSFHG